MFPFGEEKPVILDPGFFRDLQSDAAAILFVFPVNHRIEVKRPIGEGGTEVTMADGGKGCHGLADSGDLFLRHFPNHHGVSLVSGLLMSQNRPEPPDHSCADEPPDPAEEDLFLPPCLPGNLGEGRQAERQVPLDLSQQPSILRREFFFLHGLPSSHPQSGAMRYTIDEKGESSYDFTRNEKKTDEKKLDRKPGLLLFP